MKTGNSGILRYPATPNQKDDEEANKLEQFRQKLKKQKKNPQNFHETFTKKNSNELEIQFPKNIETTNPTNQAFIF